MENKITNFSLKLFGQEEILKDKNKIRNLENKID